MLNYLLFRFVASPQLDIEMIAVVKKDEHEYYTTKGKKLCYLGLETGHKTVFDYYYTAVSCFP